MSYANYAKPLILAEVSSCDRFSQAPAGSGIGAGLTRPMAMAPTNEAPEVPDGATLISSLETLAAGDQYSEGVEMGFVEGNAAEAEVLDSNAGDGFKRTFFRYAKEDLLALKPSDGHSLEKWKEILLGLGAVALELDSIAVESQPNKRSGKKQQQNDKWESNAGKKHVYEKSEDDYVPYEWNANGDQSQTAEVEYYYSDSSDDIETFQKPVFIVEGEPDFESGPPEDAWEYLRRVKWEAAQCPRVKVASISPEKLVGPQTSYILEIPSIPTCDPELLPSEEWEAEFISDFSKLRMTFATTPCPTSNSRNLPHLRNKAAWKVLCFGKTDDGKSSDGESEDTAAEVDVESQEVAESDNAVVEEPVQLPLLSVLLGLDEVSRAALLRYHISWLDELEDLPENRAKWLFALAAVVDKPIDADTSSALRALLRKCASIRASKNFKDEGELQTLNIIITIAGKYFGQAET